MPLLFSLGQHNALVAIQEDLHDNEFLFALLDDIYVATTPHRVGDVYKSLDEHLRAPESASTEERRRCGTQSTTDQSSVMYWSRSLKGRTLMPACGAVLRSLSTNKASKSWGHHWAIHSLWCEKTAAQEVLLGRIPAVLDLQSSWSLLLHCASARANYLLRVVKPEATR